MNSRQFRSELLKYFKTKGFVGTAGAMQRQVGSVIQGIEIQSSPKPMPGLYEYSVNLSVFSPEIYAALRSTPTDWLYCHMVSASLSRLVVPGVGGWTEVHYTDGANFEREISKVILAYEEFGAAFFERNSTPDDIAQNMLGKVHSGLGTELRRRFAQAYRLKKQQATPISSAAEGDSK